MKLIVNHEHLNVNTMQLIVRRMKLIVNGMKLIVNSMKLTLNDMHLFLNTQQSTLTSDYLRHSSINFSLLVPGIHSREQKFLQKRSFSLKITSFWIKKRYK